jgi:hypothetical protein
MVKNGFQHETALHEQMQVQVQVLAAGFSARVVVIMLHTCVARARAALQNTCLSEPPMP